MLQQPGKSRQDPRKDRYRKRWRWDRVAWGSHCVDCYPGNCPMRVYVRDGTIAREEQAGTFPVVEPGVPDMNPMGCQKGAAWAELLHAKERVEYPLRRAGERGEGKWRQVSWDEAMTEIADSVLDAIQEGGPESVIHAGGANASTLGLLARGRFTGLVGSVTLDVNGEITDFAAGHYMTFGMFDPVSSVDDWFHSELIFIWFANPSYTRIPHQHYINEARYDGAEVVTVSPEFSPSAVHADYHVPVRPGTDAAFALGMAQVVIEERLYNETFIKEQTDLPLLVRLDTMAYLRGCDLAEGGRDDQFYWADAGNGAVCEAPRHTLAPGEIGPALEGCCTTTLKDGQKIQVTTVFELAKQRLGDYTPEKASALCGVSPEMIRMLARKVAAKRTNVICSLSNASKYYHGDLIERSELLLLALTGNWGRKGTGVRAWTGGLFDGMGFASARQKGTPEEPREILGLMRQMVQAMKTMDPTMTDELAAIEFNKRLPLMAGAPMMMVPPAFLWYYHAGFDEVWSRADWHDPSMKRPFREYWREAMEKGWWQGVEVPGATQEPRVLIETGGNILRRTRGGQQMLLKHLWPKLKMIVSMDPRISTTGLHSDYILPVSQQYEKIAFGIPSTHTMNLTFCDKIVDPPGEAKSEWEIFLLLSAKVEERAKARGLSQYSDAKGATHKLEGLLAAMTAAGSMVDEERIADSMVRDTALTGALPDGTSLDTLRDKGYARFSGLGVSVRAVAQSSTVRPDETFTPFRAHIEDRVPYPTLTRRAQFYIDHPWFLEAGEELPRHKEPPRMGGDYPLRLTSGHSRWSIHALNVAN
ncbi:MAG TPA: molybdopterin-dependent oxidoreductase, partial [Dehalococcoidia bacterium]|nr:molybdopterin-dependent oxidoreductase [Dehalococcoidia bacterium]